MRFFEAAADWADRKSVDVKFTRDEFDGWFAILSFSDSRGPFSATVNLLPDTKKETDDAYGARIAQMMDKACVAARANRIRFITKRLAGFA